MTEAMRGGRDEAEWFTVNIWKKKGTIKICFIATVIRSAVAILTKIGSMK